MAAPDANDTGIDPDFNARFSHPTMSTAQMDGAAQGTATSSLWSNQDDSFPSHATATGFDTVHTPPLADDILAGQINAQQHLLEYEQYPEYSTDQAYWPPEHDPAQPGQSSNPSAADGPLVCPWEDCTSEYRRQGDLNKHMNNHTKRRKCEICGAGGAETKDLNRHMWTHHSDEARRLGLPKDEDRCLACGYVGRKDNVKRHKDQKGHW